MRIVQLILAVMAAAYGAGRYLQERRRLGQIEQMSGAAARAFYERHRQKHDRALLFITVAFCAAAVGLLGYASFFHDQGTP